MTRHYHHHLDPVSETLASQLCQDPSYRVLRALPRPYSTMPSDGAPPDGRCVALVDCETTSLDPTMGAIIEIAVKLVFVDEAGAVTGHFPIFSWLEDPGHPLDPQIARLTGLSDKDLNGRTIDDAAVARLLERADLAIAHNAPFDLAWIDRRWPDQSGKAWACSCSEIPWQQLGYEGRSQHHLLLQHGWFAQAAHRAASDVWALFWLLQQSSGTADPNGADDGSALGELTHLQRLIAASDKPTIQVEAAGAPFGAKDLLRARNYRWLADNRRKVWVREVLPDAAEEEQLWFLRNDLPQPRLVPITARERHR